MTLLKILETVLGKNKFWDLFKGKEKLKLELQNELVKQLQVSNLKQIDNNISESKHSSIFVAGWRPFIGWVCGAALLYQHILRDFIAMAFELSELPQLNTNQLITILLAMLGMGTLRTYEKFKKVA